MRKTKMSKQLSFAFLMFVLILVQACTPEVTSTHESLQVLLQPTPDCDLPCWNGIMPGETSEGDFRDWFEVNQGVLAKDLERFEVDEETMQYRWFDPGLERMIRTLFVNDTLQWIEIDAHPNMLGEIVDALGNPNAYMATIEGGEQDMLIFYTFYTDRGVFVDLLTIPYKTPATASSPTCKIEINGDVKARAIYIVQDDDPGKMLQTVWPVVPSSIKPWENFGEIDLSECY